MKLLDKKSNIFFNSLYLFLTQKEASELSYGIKKLLDNSLLSEITIMGEDVQGNLTKKIIIRLDSKGIDKKNDDNYIRENE